MQDFGKFKKIIIKFWPIIFIVIIWFIFANPYFIKGKVPYASTYQVNFFAPWSHYEQFWGPVKNNAMPDVHTQIYPWKKFTIDTYKSGQIPLWNPYNFSGNPHLANFQSAVLSPFNLLFFIFPFIDAWSMVVLLQPLLAGLFMYLLMRSLKVSQTGSLISCIAFMFCGFIVVWMAYGTLAYAILFLPLALLAIEKYYQTKKIRFLLLLSLTIPLSFFSGHFQISLYFLGACLFNIFFKAIITKKVLTTFYLLPSILFGLLLSLPQLIPSIELYSNSVRSELFLLGEAIPFNYLITVVSPDFFGNPVTRNDWFGHYAEWASFIGIWPFFLATYAILRARNNRILFFATLGIVSLILAVKSPLSSLLVDIRIPVISTSSFSRVIVLFSFSLAVLSGFGIDQLTKDVKGRSSRLILLLLSAIAIFIMLLWILLLFGRILPDQWLIVAKRNFILPTLLFIGGVVVVLFVKINKKLILIASYYLLVAISFDSLRFAQKWMPFDPKELVYPEVPVIQAIKRNIGQGRIFGNIGNSVLSSYYGFPSIDGYNPLYISRYGEFIRGASKGESLKGERSVVQLDRNGEYTDRALDLLGVSLVFHPIADTNQGWAYPVWKDKDRYKLIYEDDKFQLFEDMMRLGRATLFYDFEVINNSNDIIKRFYSSNFDFKRTMILEEQPKVSPSKDGKGNAQITSYTPNKVVIKVATDKEALLFLSDNFYPGWKAKVNSQDVKIYRADYTFRVVVVPKGQSIVEFIYKQSL